MPVDGLGLHVGVWLRQVDGGGRIRDSAHGGDRRGARRIWRWIFFFFFFFGGRRRRRRRRTGRFDSRRGGGLCRVLR